MKTLRTQRTSVQQQIDAIDLVAMHLVVNDAKSNLQGYETANATRLGLPAVVAERTRLRGAAAQAEHELHGAERDVDHLQRAAAKLDSLIFADARITAAEGAIQPARDGVTEARAALDGALAVQREIDDLLAAEQNTYLQQNAQAAGDVVHAQAALGAALAALNAVLHERLEAQTSASERDLHLAAYAYAQAIATHRAACSSSGAYCAEPDIDMMTREAEAEAAGDSIEQRTTP